MLHGAAGRGRVLDQRHLDDRRVDEHFCIVAARARAIDGDPEEVTELAAVQGQDRAISREASGYRAQRGVELGTDGETRDREVPFPVGAIVKKSRVAVRRPRRERQHLGVRDAITVKISTLPEQLCKSLTWDQGAGGPNTRSYGLIPAW